MKELSIEERPNVMTSKEYYMMKAKEEEINKKIEEYTTQGNCPHYDENASVCDDGECGCAECISRIRECEEKSIELDKSNVMDYEKKYKEALERAKNTIEVNQTIPDIVECVESLFPELKENEDERIRNWLIGYFNQYIIDGMPQVFGNGLNVKDVIAWLEKQGEQKPDEKVEPKFKVGDAIRLKNSNAEYIIESISDGHYYGKGFSISIVGGNRDYELVEQKPKEYAKSEDYGIDGLYNAIRILEKTLGKVDGYQTDDGILEHECAISAVKKLYEQKPTIWSKEDEEHVNSLLKRLEGLCRNEFATTRFAISEDKDWLKSLKSQNTWKPSDEQMDAMQKALVDLCGKDEHNIITGLYYDLKKLKG